MLAPAPDPPARRSPRERDAARPAPPPALAVLCAADDARAIAVAAAALLARRARHGCALACVWTPAASGDGRPLASGQARRLAMALGARGLVADACGRAAAVTLPVSPADAVGAARRALAAAGQAPTVLVIGGPRDGAFDPLLTEHDLVVVLSRGGGPDAVAALAVADLRASAGHAVAQTLALRPATRALAASGLAVPSAVRRALDGPLRELG